MKDYKPIIGITMGDPVIGPEIVVTALCESATIDEIKSHSYALTLGRYVGAEKIENDGIALDTDHWFYGHHEHLQKEEPGAEKTVRLKTSRRYGDAD